MPECIDELPILQMDAPTNEAIEVTPEPEAQKKKPGRPKKEVNSPSPEAEFNV